MRNKILIVLIAAFSACAPLSPSQPKYKVCDVTTKAATIELGDSIGIVESKMNLSHTNDVDSDGNDVWVYSSSCGNVKVTFRAGGVISVIK